MTQNLTRVTRAALLLMIVIIVSACGGTKVYDTTKTIVYKGSIYQVTDVKQIASKVEAVKADKTTVNMINMNKQQATDLINANKPLMVRMSFQMDEQELVYVATTVDSYRDYDNLRGRFESANKDIAKLMGEKKTKQLNLR